ncbi:hypothetical protein Tco_0121141 [Tanacetum coccineum]
MNYIPVSLENQTNPHAGTSEVTNSAALKHTAAKVGPSMSSTNSKVEEEVPKNKATSTTLVNSGSGPVNSQHVDKDDSDMPELTIFNKPQKGIIVSQPPRQRRQKLIENKSSVQTRSKVQQHTGAYALVSYVQKQQRNNHKDQQPCLFACFLSQEEPKKISKALKDNSWVEAMQEELLCLEFCNRNAGKKFYFKCANNCNKTPNGRPDGIDKKMRYNVLVSFSGLLQESSHLFCVKRIFKYLTGNPFGLRYPKECLLTWKLYQIVICRAKPLDRKSKTMCCLLLGSRLISIGNAKKTTLLVYLELHEGLEHAEFAVKVNSGIVDINFW